MIITGKFSVKCL